MAAPIEKTNVVVAIVYDFETGGLDCTKCAATQISMHAVRLDTFEVTEKYNAYIQPYCKKQIGKPKNVLRSKYESQEEELMEYEQSALNVSGITMGKLETYGKPLEQVCEEICDFIERNTLPVVASNKPFMVGQNPQFDKGFMQQIMVYSGYWSKFCKCVRGSKDFWGNFQPDQLDTIHLFQLTFDNDKSIATWKLENMAERLGVDLDDAHDADADVIATRESLKIITSRMRAGNNGAIAELATEKKEKMRDHFKI